MRIDLRGHSLEPTWRIWGKPSRMMQKMNPSDRSSAETARNLSARNQAQALAHQAGRNSSERTINLGSHSLAPTLMLWCAMSQRGRRLSQSKPCFLTTCSNSILRSPMLARGDRCMQSYARATGNQLAHDPRHSLLAQEAQEIVAKVRARSKLSM